MQRVVIILIIICVGFISAERPIVRIDEQKRLDIMKGILQCVAETNVDPEILATLRPGKFHHKNIDSQFQKFINCGFVKTGYGEKNGHIKVGNIVDLFPENMKEQMRTVLEKCNSKEGKTPFETTYLVYTCFKKESPVHVVLNE